MYVMYFIYAMEIRNEKYRKQNVKLKKHKQKRKEYYEWDATAHMSYNIMNVYSCACFTKTQIKWFNKTKQNGTERTKNETAT